MTQERERTWGYHPGLDAWVFGVWSLPEYIAQRTGEYGQVIYPHTVVRVFELQQMRPAAVDALRAWALERTGVELPERASYPSDQWPAHTYGPHCPETSAA